MMNNEIENIWKKANLIEQVTLNKPKLLLELNNQLGVFEKKIKNRDKLEILAAIFVIIFFSIAFLKFTDFLSKLGLFIGIIYGFIVIYLLKKVKKYKPTENTSSVKQYLLNQRNYLTKEKILLDNVIYWYLIPPTLSTLLFFIGRGMSGNILIAAIFGLIALNFAIFILNKKAVKNEIEPIIQNIDKAISYLDKKDFENSI